ncbi:hypothetical protein [Tsukamurella soli]|uniref:hypothetical protein n=1 Tax=Tsukamurella soli TaxID=644556 RepID=UPI003610E336
MSAPFGAFGPAVPGRFGSAAPGGVGAPTVPGGGWMPPDWSGAPPWAGWWTPPPSAPDASGAQEQNQSSAAPTDPAPTNPAPTDPAPEPAPSVSAETVDAEQHIPPRWDPLGAAPFAWDLPEPAPEFASESLVRSRSRVTTVTFGLALVTAAVLAGARLAGVTALSPVMIGAIALGIVGLGLVIGAFRRSGYGLLAVAIPLAGFVVIGTAAQNSLDGFTGAARGDHTYTVITPGSLRPAYELSVGTLTLDLRGLRLDHDRTVSTRVGAGKTRITVPKAMNVAVTCAVRIGHTDCPDGEVAETDPAAPTLTIDAHGNVGDVEVHRV